MERDAIRSQLDAVVARTMHDCDTARHQLEHLNGCVADPARGGRVGHASCTTACRSTSRPSRRLEMPSMRAVPSSGRSQQDLERVLEQRSAAAAAIEEADGELAELAGLGHGRERRCGASSRPPGRRSATPRRSTRRRWLSLESLQIEATGLQVRREAAQTRPGARGRRRCRPSGHRRRARRPGGDPVRDDRWRGRPDGRSAGHRVV